MSRLVDAVLGAKVYVMVGLATLVVGIGLGFTGGLRWQAGEVQKVKNDALTAQNNVLNGALQHAYTTGSITAELGLKAAERQVAIATNTREIVREVPARITREDDARCSINNGAVRLHDAAAAGIPTEAVPFAAGQPDGAPAGIALSGLIGGAVVPNYGTCRQVRQQLIDLQAWVKAQQAVAP